MPSEKVGYTESFDLLFRGLEISSGGQRVHDFDQLVERMTERGLRLEDNPGYLQAYRSGMPPHGGAGVGLERLVQRLTGISNIRQVSLFPRDPARVLP
jgi:aspartyl/asparaginyl-tRNA synthetase